MEAKAALEAMRALVKRCSNRQLSEVVNGLNKLRADPAQAELVRLPLAVAMAEHSRRIEEWLVSRFESVPVGAWLKPYAVAADLAREFGGSAEEYRRAVGEFMCRAA